MLSGFAYSQAVGFGVSVLTPLTQTPPLHIRLRFHTCRCADEQVNGVWNKYRDDVAHDVSDEGHQPSAIKMPNWLGSMLFPLHPLPFCILLEAFINRLRLNSGRAAPVGLHL